ncbi:hypothetical protein [Thioalkalivibrio paradoxus]|uniref:Uncharacterized protein n=1 Tax=Thioalkalivibrio paradoxus ARh 1 TaxID=713585 RepID=W0DN44_9GAMM|nr:hypothetical protein [Thioalkalivibrio paradoxus]AHE99876.1 hypothetical protein THITH_02735 [Thioalkalivibrio paradoxus ARh 1]
MMNFRVIQQTYSEFPSLIESRLDQRAIGFPVAGGSRDGIRRNLRRGSPGSGG